MILLGCIPAIVVEWRLAVSATNLSQRWSDTQNHFRMIGWHTHTHIKTEIETTNQPSFAIGLWTERSRPRTHSLELRTHRAFSYPGTIYGESSTNHSPRFTRVLSSVNHYQIQKLRCIWQIGICNKNLSAMNGFVLRYMVPYPNDWDDSKWHPNSWLGWYISYYYLHSSPFYPYLLVGSFFIIFGLHQGTKVSDTWWRSPWLQMSNTWTWPDKNATDPTKQQPACDHERDQATKYPTSPPNWATQLPHAETTILTKEYQGVYGEVYNPWVAQRCDHPVPVDGSQTILQHRQTQEQVVLELPTKYYPVCMCSWSRIKGRDKAIKGENNMYD